MDREYGKTAARRERLVSRSSLQRVTRNLASRRQPFSIIFFSIDRFKLINTRFGYESADAVLERVYRTARHGLGVRGDLSRWSGDEFVAILPEATVHDAFAIAEHLRQLIEGVALRIDNAVVNTTASFGVASFPEDGGDCRTLMAAVNEALSEAKRGGRNRVVLARSLTKRILETGAVLESALREDRVMPAYQRIVDLRSGETVAEEALARIVTAEGSIIAAEEFIDVATQFQLTHKIDRTVLISALRRGCDTPGIARFINVSGDLLRHPELLKDVLALAKWQTGEGECKPPVIEVTERELLSNLDSARRVLAPFLDAGLLLALDDFGSGYSSFEYLADLPVSYLKIDGRLIRRVDEPKTRAIVRGIQNIAADVGVTTIAEYVETERQVELLGKIGIDWAQGHYYGRALVDAAEAARRREMGANWARDFYHRRPVTTLPNL